MTKRSRDTYRNVDLIVRQHDSGVRGKAWRNGKELGDVRAGSEAETFLILREIVDSAFTIDTDAAPATYPTEEAYRGAFAFLSRNLADTYVAMLRAHYRAPEQTMTARQLAASAGYADWGSANLHYGKVGRLVGEFLLFQPRRRKFGEPIWTLMLAEGAEENAPEEKWQWKMRPQVATALASLGIV